ncbi:MalY/PatB family protein [Oleidesulfovibrio sp.]|uniref:MalY/PatB family protein n=1 Tax=Oleidesulfovibrio sp. TaxID=2909707 RepID=UPI003A875BA8
MQYDFDTRLHRLGTRSEKWDEMETRYGVPATGDPAGIAMWVADMDFKSPPAVNEAVAAMAQTGLYGYPGAWHDHDEALTSWLSRRHGWNIHPQWVLRMPNVVTALHLIIQAFTGPDEGIIVQPPVYPPFLLAPQNNGRKVLENPLRREEGPDGPRFVMDYDNLEEQCRNGGKVLILCSPHNPGGRVWHKEELSRLAEICLKYDVLIVSDEIHHDLVYEGHTHTMLATIAPEIADRTITCISATKTFNLAGSMLGLAVVQNAGLRARLQKTMHAAGLFDPSAFGLAMSIAAYNHGDAWRKELLTYLDGNRQLVQQQLGTVNGIEPMRPEATYLTWIDFEKTGLPKDAIIRKLQQEARLALNHGATFGTGGELCMRLNFACPRSVLQEALDRIINVFSG